VGEKTRKNIITKYPTKQPGWSTGEGGGKIEAKTDVVHALLSEPTMNHKALIP